jgi:hypothetical protein
MKMANIVGNIKRGILALFKCTEEVKIVLIQLTLVMSMSFCPLSSA